MSATLRIACHGRTVTGKVRHNNEDTLWVSRVDDPDGKPGDRECVSGMGYPGVLLAVFGGMALSIGPHRCVRAGVG